MKRFPYDEQIRQILLWHVSLSGDHDTTRRLVGEGIAPNLGLFRALARIGVAPDNSLFNILRHGKSVADSFHDIQLDDGTWDYMYRRGLDRLPEDDLENGNLKDVPLAKPKELLKWVEALESIETPKAKTEGGKPRPSDFETVCSLLLRAIHD